jgi:TRAP-type C4-dicarboxylate transport system substrate-binding protein
LRTGLGGLAIAGAAVAIAACGSSSSGSSGGSGGSGATSATNSASGSGGSGGGSSVKLRLSTDLPTGVPFNDLILNGLPKAVSKSTGGSVQIVNYPNNELYKTQTLALSAAQRGQVDLVVTNNLQAQPIIPAMDGPSLGFIAPTTADYYKLLGPDTPFMKEASAEAATKGLVIVGAGGASPGPGGVIFTSSTPTDTLNSVKGQKVRVPGQGLLADELQSLGAQAVPLSTTEVAPSVSSGTVSAAIGSASFALGELKGLAHGYLDSQTFQFGPYFIFASKTSWNKLSPSQQAGLTKAARGLYSGWLSHISQSQKQADQSLVKAGMWVKSLPAAEQKTLTTQFQKSSWLKFKSEDPKAYAALLATRKQLGFGS